MSSNLWAQGILDFNEGRFWEAHHDWEAGWNKLPSPNKEYLRSLIQACGVFYHLEKRHFDPARRLAVRIREAMAPMMREGALELITPRIEIPGLLSLIGEIESGLALSLTPDDARVSAWLESAKRLKAKLCPT